MHFFNWICPLLLDLVAHYYVYIRYIKSDKSVSLVTGQDSTSVERRPTTWEGCGFESHSRRWNLSSILWDFFVIISPEQRLACQRTKLCRKLRHCSTLSRIKSVLQSSKLEIVELHTNVSRTHWSMGNGLRNAEKIFSQCNSIWQENLRVCVSLGTSKISIVPTV